MHHNGSVLLTQKCEVLQTSESSVELEKNIPLKLFFKNLLKKLQETDVKDL